VEQNPSTAIVLFSNPSINKLCSRVLPMVLNVRIVALSMSPKRFSVLPVVSLSDRPPVLIVVQLSMLTLISVRAVATISARMCAHSVVPI
jgi:hypothetical protein